MRKICSRSILSAEAVHGSCRGLDYFRAAFNQRCVTRVNESTLLTADLINVTSTDLYSLIVLVSMARHLCINISLDALVVSRALPVSESDTMCSAVACHWSARLIPFRVATSSARFKCHSSFSGRSQQASSMMDPLSPRATSIAS